MRKFYKTANATRAIKAHGKPFVFEPLPAFGGAIPGVFSTDVEQDQIALDDAAANPTSGVKEITLDEWERMTKKKFLEPNSTTSTPSRATSLNLPLVATPSNQPARLVEEPVKSVSSSPGGPAPIQDINDVLKIESVKPAVPREAPKRARYTKPKAEKG